MIRIFYKIQDVGGVFALLAASAFFVMFSVEPGRALAESGFYSNGSPASNENRSGFYRQNEIFYKDESGADIMRTPPRDPQEGSQYNPYYNGGSIYPEVNIYPPHPGWRPNDSWRRGYPEQGWTPGRPPHWNGSWNNHGGKPDRPSHWRGYSDRPGRPSHHGHGSAMRSQ